MNAICKLISVLCPYGELAGRVGLSLIFLVSGFGKIGAGYAGTRAYMSTFGVPGELLPLVIAVEIIGAGAIIVGYQTRWAALALAAFTVLTGLLFHFDFGDRMQQILLMKNFAIAGGLLILAGAGAGRFSIDALRRKSS